MTKATMLQKTCKYSTLMWTKLSSTLQNDTPSRTRISSKNNEYISHQATYIMQQTGNKSMYNSWEHHKPINGSIIKQINEYNYLSSYHWPAATRGKESTLVRECLPLRVARRSKSSDLSWWCAEKELNWLHFSVGLKLNLRITIKLALEYESFYNILAHKIHYIQ